jgi:hypothetical protein
MPAGLISPSWSCSVPQGACQPASGVGPIATLVNLDVDGTATITLDGVVGETTAFLPFTLDVALPAGVEGNVFGSGIEDVDVLSDGYIHYGSFEGDSP